MSLSTHVLDQAHGKPAPGVEVRLEVLEGGTFRELHRARTDIDGRIRGLLPDGGPQTGTFRLVFEVAAYFEAHGVAAFYPYVPIVFTIARAGEHYHVPLLLAPWGYSTYRGS